MNLDTGVHIREYANPDEPIPSTIRRAYAAGLRLCDASQENGSTGAFTDLNVTEAIRIAETAPKGGMIYFRVRPLIRIVVTPVHLLGAEILRREVNTTDFQGPVVFFILDRKVDGDNIIVVDQDVTTAQIDPRARDAFLEAIASVNRDASHLGDLCQDAHDALTKVGAPTEGTPAKRIEAMFN